MKKTLAVMTIATSIPIAPPVEASSVIDSSIENENKIATDLEENISSIEATRSLVGTVTSSTLNVRSTPDTSRSPIGKLYKGNSINIIEVLGNGWLKINYNSKIAYVSGKYVDVKNNVSPDYVVENMKATGKVVGLPKNESLNVRSLPSTAGTVLYSVNEGDFLNIEGKTSNGWYRINVNGKIGFANSKFISITTQAPETQGKMGEIYGLKPNDTLNIRTGPSTSYNVSFKLSNGNTVEILDKSSNGWLYISYNGNKGYCNSKFVREVSNNIPDNSVGIKYKTTADINLRKTASWSGEISRVAKKGELLTVLSINNEWAKLSDGLYAPIEFLAKADTPSVEKPTVKKYKVTVDINIRKSPSWSSEKLEIAKSGTILDVVSINGDWAQIFYKEQYLYVPSSYLLEVTNSNESEQNKPNLPSTITYTVKDDINLRKSASWDAEKVYRVKKGSNLEVIETNENWAKVYYLNQELYAPAEYLHKGSSLPPVEPEKPSTPNTKEYRATADINLRKTASWSGEVVKIIKSGETLKVVNYKDDWSEVYYDGNTVFAPSSYLIDASISIPNEETTKYTKYPFTLNKYAKLQNSKNPKYSVSYFENYLNPNNCNKYEFLELDKFRDVNTEKMNKMLLEKDAGVLKGTAESIKKVAKKYNLDPLYFLIQSIHETGYGKSTLAKGVRITEIADVNKPIKDSNGNIKGYQMIKLKEPTTVYNLFGIGAQDNLPTMPNRALVLGTTYAYNAGWTTVEKSLDGAGDFLSKNYVNSTKYDQNTLYKIRYNPSETYLWHQYSTTPWYSRDIATLIQQYDYMYEPGVSFSYDRTQFTDIKSSSLIEKEYPIQKTTLDVIDSRILTNDVTSK